MTTEGFDPQPVKRKICRCTDFSEELYVGVFSGTHFSSKKYISTGNAITPREVRYHFKFMLEDRTIDIIAHNLETVLAEKLESIITRAVTNTRMRDFYDVNVLYQLYGKH